MHNQQEIIGGMRSFVCRGMFSSPVRFHLAADQLLNAYAENACDCVWGIGEGCWEALWLAGRFNIRLLVLESFQKSTHNSPVRRAALENLFSIVCPVTVDWYSAPVLPELPNTNVHITPRGEGLPEALKRLGFANEL